MFASVNGYEKSAPAAIITGGCNWACSFGPVLRSGLTGVSEPDAGEFETVLAGRRFRVVVSNLDRAMMFSDADPSALIQDARARAGAVPWLTPQILAAPELPLLTATGPTLVSVFVSYSPNGEIVEVKINGADWGPSCHNIDDPSVPVEGGMVMLRELAVLTPIEPAPPFERAAVQSTLDGLAERNESQQVAGWPGWQVHGGRLGPVLADIEVSVIEVHTGPLPADYRHFLTEVAGPGAGPGYGLSYPRKVDNSILLAHGGCGYVWLLRLDPVEYGTVWADASDSDDNLVKVADSFSEWFAGWLDSGVRDAGAWINWDSSACSTAGILVQVLEDRDRNGRRSKGEGISLAGTFGPAAIKMTAGGGYLPAGSPSDPCHGCVTLVGHFDVGPEVFAPGILSVPPPPNPAGT